MSEQLHSAQMSILYSLRHARAARFSTLMGPTGMESDTFKFHLRKLCKLGYVEKLPSGQYQLTASGKEFANKLDKSKLMAQQQPKLSVLLLVPEPGEQVGEPRFLFQQRRRNPYFGFWSCIVGPVQWGESAEEAALRELTKQTGLSAACQVRSFYRERSYDTESALLLEDKMFVVIEASDVKGELSNAWHGGHNAWMTESEFGQQPKHFKSVCDALAMLRQGKTYASQKASYSPDEY